MVLTSAALAALLGSLAAGGGAAAAGTAAAGAGAAGTGALGALGLGGLAGGTLPALGGGAAGGRSALASPLAMAQNPGLMQSLGGMWKGIGGLQGIGQGLGGMEGITGLLNAGTGLMGALGGDGGAGRLAKNNATLVREQYRAKELSRHLKQQLYGMKYTGKLLGKDNRYYWGDQDW